MSTTTLLLDTRYSENYETPYKTKFEINFPALNTIGNYAVKLQSVEIPNTVFPINEYTNQLSLSEDGGTLYFQVSLPFNNYSGTSLATELALQMSSSSPNGDTYTAVYNSQSKRMVITNPSRAWHFGAVANSMYFELGVGTKQLGVDVAVASGVWPLTGSSSVNIAGTSYVDVITNLSAHSHSVGLNRQVLVRVPITVPFGNIIFYEPAKIEEQYVSHAQLNEIWIELRDDRNNLFKLDEYAHVSMNLGIRQLLNERIPDQATAERMHSERSNLPRAMTHPIGQHQAVTLDVNDDVGWYGKY